MRLIHRVPFQPHEIEFYRQLVFQNLTYGLKVVLEAMEDLELEMGDGAASFKHLIEDAPDIKDGEHYPDQYRQALGILWADAGVQRTVERGNEFALPEKCDMHALSPRRMIH
jgi:guanine nucleotide-binding protein subunit alpha, other